jgi:rfaE bifunctional protein kinase chain/domain
MDQLEIIIDRFHRRRVVVLGDFLVDEFVHGDIARVSREAPVLILDHTLTAAVPGGGGNTVANLHALGAVPIPVGRVGQDPAGEFLLDTFRDAGIPVSGILRDRSYSTPTKSRVLAGGIHTRRQQIVRIDRGARRDEQGEPPAALGKRLATATKRCHGMLVADYGYGTATPGMVRDTAPGLIRKGLPVTVDSRTRGLEFGGLTACTPNQEEVEQAVGTPLSEDDQVVESAGRRLLKKTRHQAVLVTRGAAGMSLLEKGRRVVRIPACGGGGDVADVTGAGDTVIATFTLALSAGASCENAARLANFAAGTVVSKAGTATLTPEELRQAVRMNQR